MKKEQKYFLAVDLGTQGIKVALVDVTGTARDSSFSPAVFNRHVDNVIDQDTERMYADLLKTLRQTIEKSGISPSDILAVGVVGQMAGIVGIDEHFLPVTPYDSGLDKRCESNITDMKALGEDRIIQLCGCPVIVAQGAKMVWWKQNRSAAYSRVRKFIPISSYICGKMAGLKTEDAYLDYTHIHLTCMADNLRNEWSDELISLLGFDRQKLPEIVEPTKIIGSVTSACAELTGLLCGTPIVAGCGDTAASGVGAGLVKSDAILDIAGTASVLAACVDEYHPDVQDKVLIYQRSIMPNLWMPFGFVLGGQALDWYMGQICGENPVTFAHLDAEAKDIQNDSLYFLPYLAGRICPSNPRFSGDWLGIKFYHTRANMYRSIMESIAYEYLFFLKRLRKLLPDIKPDHMITSGGGAKSMVFTQIKADVLGLPLVMLKQKDTTYKAAAILAGYGVGAYRDISETVRIMTENEQDQRILPNAVANVRYLDQYRKYMRIVSYMETLHDEIQL